MSQGIEAIRGSVLRIERSSIHDGEGMRTVLFLKGCSLRCTWCSTPESQKFEPEKGYLSELCTGCGRCIEACPSGALVTGDDKNYVILEWEKCLSCFCCVDTCYQGAQKKYGHTLSVEEVIQEVARDEVFYFYSGGGLTISGGEPFNQASFTAEILKACKKMGINTAVESSLNAPYDDLKKSLPWLDLLYADIKQMNSDIHRQWIGEGNSHILRNLKKIDRSAHPLKITIRIPLIPGFNDDDQNLLATAKFCSHLDKFKEIEILPYHRLGIDTYKHLGILCSCADLIPPDPDYTLAKARFIKNKFPDLSVKTGSNTI
jgi:pyruvate formate lyase activating enzyme